MDQVDAAWYSRINIIAQCENLSQRDTENDRATRNISIDEHMDLGNHIIRLTSYNGKIHHWNTKAIKSSQDTIPRVTNNNEKWRKTRSNNNNSKKMPEW